jgi:hypothetical protein
MGVLIRMPQPRFERTPFKTHGAAIILSKCNRCGARRVGSFADGSLNAWETSHRCESANTVTVAGKEVG